MAKEYIERGALLEKLLNSGAAVTDYGKFIIENFPTADVVEVKHGRWQHIGGDEWCCTNCGEVVHTEGSWEKPTYKYCHECGADMRERRVNDG